MSAKSLYLVLPFALSALIPKHCYAVIIEGKFSGKVRSAYECVNLRPDQVGTCSPLWEENPEGTIATGSFWYDTAIAPPDTSVLESFGNYFTYTNEWVNVALDIGGKHFDISDSSTVNDEMWDVEYITVVDSQGAPNGSELQSITITDKTSSGSFTGNFITKGVSLNIATWEKPIVSGTSLIQEYELQENGNLLQGVVYFDYESFIDDDRRLASSRIELTEFSMNIRRELVPEPSHLALFLLAVIGMFSRRRFLRHD